MLVAYSHRHRRNFEQLEMENNLKLVIKLHALALTNVDILNTFKRLVNNILKC